MKTKMDKKNLKKWLAHLKTFENFKQKSLPDEIKAISHKIRQDLIKNGNKSFNRNYLFGGISLNIITNFKVGDKDPYYSNINIYDILNGVEPIKIETIIVDKKVDIDYLMSIISHEIRHIYDIFTVKSDCEIEDFKKSLYIKSLKNKNVYFLDLVYLSLEHELIAFYNMIYESYRWNGVTDKSKLYDIFKTSYTYLALIKLKNFDSEKFVNEYNLLDFTNEFSDYFDEPFDGDILKYYKKWEDFFHKKSNEFLSYIDLMLDDIINDILENKIYEFYKDRYREGTEIFKIGLSGKLFKQMIEEKNI